MLPLWERWHARSERVAICCPDGGFMRLALTVVLALGVGGAALIAQEHPEHPEGKTAASRAISIDDLEKAIKSAVAAKEKSGGGYYKLADEATKKTWLLKLDHVHRERLSRLDEKTYFACTDFKSSDGHTVDVDFFMKDKDGKLVMSNATLHKIDVKPRYNWEEKNGFWQRVPVKG